MVRGVMSVIVPPIPPSHQPDKYHLSHVSASNLYIQGFKSNMISPQEQKVPALF
jgi:hypothetical protein